MITTTLMRSPLYTLGLLFFEYLLGSCYCVRVGLKNILGIIDRLLVRDQEKLFVFTQLKEGLVGAKILDAVVHSIVVLDHGDLTLFEVAFYLLYL